MCVYIYIAHIENFCSCPEIQLVQDFAPTARKYPKSSKIFNHFSIETNGFWGSAIVRNPYFLPLQKGLSRVKRWTKNIASAIDRNISQSLPVTSLEWRLFIMTPWNSSNLPAPKTFRPASASASHYARVKAEWYDTWTQRFHLESDSFLPWQFLQSDHLVFACSLLRDHVEKKRFSSVFSSPEDYFRSLFGPLLSTSNGNGIIWIILHATHHVSGDRDVDLLGIRQIQVIHDLHKPRRRAAPFLGETRRYLRK